MGYGGPGDGGRLLTAGRAGADRVGVVDERTCALHNFLRRFQEGDVMWVKSPTALEKSISSPRCGAYCL